MSSRNSVNLVGRLVKENELNQVNGGSQNLRNVIAVDRNYKNGNGDVDTDFVKFVAWNGIAKAIKDYTEKGNMISIEGEIRTSVVEKNGNTYYNTEVMVNDVGFIDFSGSTNNNNENTEDTQEESEENIDEALEDLDEEFDVPF